MPKLKDASSQWSQKFCEIPFGFFKSMNCDCVNSSKAHEQQVFIHVHAKKTLIKLVAGVIGTHVSLKSMRLYIFMYFVHEGLKKPVATHANDFYGPKGLKGLKKSSSLIK